VVDLSEAAMRHLDPAAGLLHVRIERVPHQRVPLQFR
jgi:hypothetical protein